MHWERAVRGGIKVTHPYAIEELPEGTFVELEGAVLPICIGMAS